MAAPTEVFATIATAQVDADSPVDVTLMGSIRSNLINLNEQMIGPSTAPLYVAAQSHDHDGINSAPIVLKTYSSGAHTIFRSTIESVGSSSTSYSDQLTVGLPFAGTLRIRYDLHSKTTQVGITANGNIFRNGSAVGTESSQLITGSTVLITYTEDVAGWLSNDVLQIRTKAGSVSTAAISAKNLVISVSTASISQIALTVPVLATT